MPIIVDVWGGELHQELIEHHVCNSWADVFALVRKVVERGDLANVVPFKPCA